MSTQQHMPTQHVPTRESTPPHKPTQLHVSTQPHEPTQLHVSTQPHEPTQLHVSTQPHEPTQPHVSTQHSSGAENSLGPAPGVTPQIHPPWPHASPPCTMSPTKNSWATQRHSSKQWVMLSLADSEGHTRCYLLPGQCERSRLAHSPGLGHTNRRLRLNPGGRRHLQSREVWPGHWTSCLC